MSSWGKWPGLRWNWGGWVVLAALTVAALLVTEKAWGHGAAAWIMNNPETRWCCGPQDCSELEDGAVRRVDGGYQVALPDGKGSEFWPENKALVSVDQHYWGCRYPVSYSDGQGDHERGHLRCFFRPAIGF